MTRSLWATALLGTWLRQSAGVEKWSFLKVGIHPWDKELPTPSSSLLTILPYWNMTSYGTICMDQPLSQHLHPCLTQMSQAKAPNPKQLQAPLPLKPSPPPQKPLQSPSSETWPISNCPYALFIWQFLKK